MFVSWPEFVFEHVMGETFPGLERLLVSCSDEARVRPSPTPSPTDPVPAGPRTAGRRRTRHLARKFGNLDAQNTRGSHTPPPSPSFACVILSPRSGGLGGRSFALVGFCRGNAQHGMIEPTRQRPRHRDGLPRAARNCGGRLPRCRATPVLPPSGGRTRVSAFRRQTSDSALEPTRGRPRPRDGLPRAARICGGRLPRCRAMAVLPKSGMPPKCG